MSGYHAETFDTLRLICASGTVTSQELSEMLGIGCETSKRRLLNMRDRGFLDSNAETLKPGMAASYSVSLRGKKLLAKLDDPEMGDVAQSRQPTERQPYVPKPWNIRPGGRQHESIPSRRGDDLVSHRLPISMAGDGT